MSQTEIVVQGTLTADGTIQLDEKPNLPPGRVTVVVKSVPDLPRDDPFWQRMQAIWAIPISNPDGGAGSLEEVRKMREEWDEHQQQLERLQGDDI
jgi:hypothetical protein